MTTKLELSDGHLNFLKALSRPTDYQKLLIELYEKQIEPTSRRKTVCFNSDRESQHSSQQSKKEMQNLLNAEKTKEKALERKARTKRLIELGALFDIANLGHHDPATLVGMLSVIKIAPDDPKWTNWHKQGVSILQERKQAKNANQSDLDS